jgi:hypothetical protein
MLLVCIMHTQKTKIIFSKMHLKHARHIRLPASKQRSKPTTRQYNDFNPALRPSLHRTEAFAGRQAERAG